MDEETQIVVLNGERRPWTEIVPDQWFYADHLAGRELTLTIKSVEAEETKGKASSPYMTFVEDDKRLGLSRESRFVLSSLFGPSPSDCIGKQITITAVRSAARGNANVIKILPHAPLPVPKSQLELDPPTPKLEFDPPATKPKRNRRKKSTDEVNDK